VSQSTGIERKVEVAATPEGVRVAIRDGKKGTVLDPLHGSSGSVA
jgi:hypothetical protein